MANCEGQGFDLVKSRKTGNRNAIYLIGLTKQAKSFKLIGISPIQEDEMKSEEQNKGNGKKEKIKEFCIRCGTLIENGLANCSGCYGKFTAKKHRCVSPSCQGGEILRGVVGYNPAKEGTVCGRCREPANINIAKIL